MTTKPTKVASWFAGTHEQLMDLLAKARGKKQTKPTATAVDYDAMTVAELKATAKEKGLKGYTALKKADLIQFLKDNA